ncbi:MAG: sodium/calcium exchanger protein, partial [Nocardioidaceae bacterium]
DLFGKRGTGLKPLTYRAASLTLVLEALVVVAVLAVVVAGSQLSPRLVVLRLTPDVVLITALWVSGLWLVQRAGHGLPWHKGGEAPDASPHPPGPRVRTKDDGSRSSGSSGSGRPRRSTTTTTLLFAGSAAVTLVAGVVLERAGEAAASRIGMSGVLFGATVLALATSLPEISTGLQAVRQGDDNLAVSDIFGGNAFLPVLFLVATVITGEAVLPALTGRDIYLTAFEALLTLVYAVGSVFRPQRRVLGMGPDSLGNIAHPRRRGQVRRSGLPAQG